MDLMDYRRKIIANSPHLKSVSGAMATFSDGEDLPLNSLNVNIEPVQSGSGDPSPDNVRPISGWSAVNVTLSGVNKLPPMVDGTYTGNGLTAVVKDGVATLSGTSTASGNALIIPLAEEYTVTEGYLHLCNSVANASFAPTLEDVNAISASGIAWACSPVNRVGAIPSNRIGQKWNRVRVWIGSGVTISGTYAPMVCADNTVRPYEPYNGVTVTIDLGQTVYGGTLNPLTGVLTAYPYYASYNGETLTGRWVSDRDKYVAGTTPTIGAQVVDMSGTGTEIQLTPHQIRSLYGNNTIFADTGNVALEYWAHP